MLLHRLRLDEDEGIMVRRRLEKRSRSHISKAEGVWGVSFHSSWFAGRLGSRPKENYRAGTVGSSLGLSSRRYVLSKESHMLSSASRLLIGSDRLTSARFWPKGPFMGPFVSEQGIKVSLVSGKDGPWASDGHPNTIDNLWPFEGGYPRRPTRSRLRLGTVRVLKWWARW